jgi:hypothetical protein
LGIPQIKINGNFLPVSNTDSIGVAHGAVKGAAGALKLEIRPNS